MATEDSGTSSAARRALPGELPTLLAQAEDLLRQLQALQQECGTYLEQLATVDWATLAQQGKLAGIPKFTIERTIIDARNVLNSGLRDLAGILRVPQESGHSQDALDEFAGRVRAMVRLYADTPTDMRHRYQRLTTWMAKIDQALQQHGQSPLTARLGVSHDAPSG
jgi:hypothetical protein